MQHHHHRRNLGNGYRAGPPPRISPDYRYFSGPPPGASFQPPPPQPSPPFLQRKSDIFTEAGRLAAEYLVSQGLLSPSVLSSAAKWYAKRPSVRPNSDLEGGTRTSALARLGGPISPNFDADPDVICGRRRTGDDSAFRAQSLKSSSGSRRRLACSSSYRGFSSGVSENEYPRSASFQGRLSYTDADDHSTNLVSEQQRLENDSTPEFESRVTDPQKTTEDCSTGADVDEIIEKHDITQKAVSEAESSNDPPDLRTSLTMCLTKIPTRTRSSKAPKIPKLHHDPPLPELEMKAPLDDNPESSLGISVTDKGKRQASENELDLLEGPKRPRDWPSSSVVLDAGGQSEAEFAQEKQAFPSSFKICDLNLMEVSDSHENRSTGDSIVNYPTLMKIKTESEPPVDIDLSITNSIASIKEIEVIDLDNDSSPEDKDLIEETTQAVYSDLDFPTHTQNTVDIPDAQDGYGLMISELLGNDFPNCSSVPDQINPIHSDIGLHNGEGALGVGDDDSIYMSLGEIPLTYLRPWEQPPPQEYEKPF